jgi:hypothetical protein
MRPGTMTVWVSVDWLRKHRAQGISKSCRLAKIVGKLPPAVWYSALQGQDHD